MAVKKSRRKKLITIIIICSVLLILLALHCFLFNYLKYPKLNSLAEYSQYPIGPKTYHLIDEIIKEKTRKVIVLWTPFFGQTDYLQSRFEKTNCLESNCVFTSNRSLLRDSSAVIFHLRDLDVNDWPKYRAPDQRYILLNHESPPNTPNILHKIDGLINWTATYRYGSDIFLSPKFRRRLEPNPEYKADRNYGQNKSRMIVWLSSNCKTDSNREAFVEELQKTVTVDVFGKCGHKQCLPKGSAKCLAQMAKEYRFLLAFENSICRDYVTEKFFDSIHFDIIPVVFGGSDYRKIAPKKSFINALSYTSSRHLARYLLYLSKNPKQYNEYFKWKRDYELYIEDYSCQICKKLNNPSEPVKVWNNLADWWFEKADCRTWQPNKYFH